MSQEKVFQMRPDAETEWFATTQEKQEEMVNKCGWLGRVLFTEPSKEIERLEAELRVARAETSPKRLTPKEVSEQIARDAIDGAILKGRMNIDPPPSPDHWLNEYWQIGRQLAEYGKTGADNVNLPDDAAAPCRSSAG